MEKDIYEEYLTQSEIQDNITKVNGESELQCCAYGKVFAWINLCVRNMIYLWCVCICV